VLSDLAPFAFAVIQRLVAHRTTAADALALRLAALGTTPTRAAAHRLAAIRAFLIIPIFA
jgi:hypothetical protein